MSRKAADVPLDDAPLPHLDLYRAFSEDPYRAIQELREQRDGPLHPAKSARCGGLLLRHCSSGILWMGVDAARTTNFEDKGEQGAGPLALEYIMREGMLLHMDPKRHNRIRRIMTGAARAIDRAEPRTVSRDRGPHDRRLRWPRRV
jgi:cytochrome P450